MVGNITDIAKPKTGNQNQGKICKPKTLRALRNPCFITPEDSWERKTGERVSQAKEGEQMRKATKFLILDLNQLQFAIINEVLRSSLRGVQTFVN